MSNPVAKALWIAATILAVTGLGASPATAQSTPIVEKCGATVESQVATNNSVTRITSRDFKTLHESEFPIPLAVAGDCVVVLFTAETACRGTSGKDRCYIQALHNGELMKPRGGGEHTFDSESSTPSSRAFAWVTRDLLAGLNTFTIRVRVGAAGTEFVIDEWTMQVQLLS